MVSNLNLLESRRRILLNTPHIETVSDTIASFKTDVATKLKGCKVYFTPIQEGEGDPSPENVRPIHGWDGVSVTKASKNLIDFNTATYIYHAWVNNGVIKPTASYNLYSFKIPQNTILTLSRNKDTNSVGCVCAISTEDAAVGKSYSVGFPTITNRIYYTFNSGDCNYLWFCIVSSADISIYEWQLEVGNNRTSYESPSSTSISIPFNRTIYGGYVDLVKGKVVEENQVIILDGTQTIMAAAKADTALATSRYFRILKTGVSLSAMLGYSNMTSASSVSIWYAPATKDIWKFCVNNDALHVCFDNTTLNIASDDSSAIRSDKISSWLADNNMLFVLPLETPNTYSIDPQTLKALRCMNNIWSDANGNIEVSYYTH